MKKILNQDIKTLLSDFLSRGSNDSYTEDYIGVIEDNNDPLKYGRCRIRVHGLYDDIPTEELPWATPKNNIAFGKKSSFIVPEIGSVVDVRFEDGDMYEPVYFGKVLDIQNIDFIADKDEDYPDSVIIYETENGDYVKVNRAKGELTIQTGAGVLCKFNQNGDIVLTNESTENGDAKINVRGNFTLDNRLGNINLITNTCNLSAFGDVNVTSNGAISYESLDDFSIKTNRQFDVTTGDRTIIKSRKDFRTESYSNTVMTNDYSINPALSMGQTSTNVDGTIDTTATNFVVSIGDDVEKVVNMTVEPNVLGGPFNAIPFDTLTGLPHQGRIAIGTILPTFADDALDRTEQVAKLIEVATENNTKQLNNALQDINKKYSSFDTQTQLVVGGAAAISVIAVQKATEIETTTTYYSTALTEEITNIKSQYLTYLTTPIFGTTTTDGYEKNRVTYNASLASSESVAELDITGKTRPADIAGAGDGLIGDN